MRYLTNSSIKKLTIDMSLYLNEQFYIPKSNNPLVVSEDSRKSDSEHTFDKPEARSSRIKVPIKKSTVIFKKLLMVKGGGGKGSTGGENGHLNRPRYEKRCVRNVFFSFFFLQCVGTEAALRPRRISSDPSFGNGFEARGKREMRFAGLASARSCAHRHRNPLAVARNEKRKIPIRYLSCVSED